MKLIFAICLSFGFTLASDSKLRCRFEEPVGLNAYICTMQNRFIASDPVNQVIGTHIKGRTNPAVTTFYVGISTLFLPTHVCANFENLKKIQVQSTNLQEIVQENFAKCEKVTEVAISKSKLTWIPSNAFNDLPNLENLRIDYGKVEFLPANLFAKNLKLKSLNFDNNNLNIINTKLPTSMISVSLKLNPCVSASFPGTYSKMSQLITYIDLKCKLPAIDKEIFLRESMNADPLKKSDGSELEKCRKNCNTTKSTLELYATQLKNKIANITNENQEKSKEIEILKAKETKSRKEIENLSNEIIQLKLTLKKKSDDLDECQNNSSVMHTSFLELKDNSTKISRENSALSESLKKMNSSYEKVSKQKMEISAMVNSMDSDNQNLTAQIENFRRNISESQVILDELTKSVNRSEYEIALCKNDRASIKESLTQKISDLTKKITKLQSQNADKLKEIKILNENHANATQTMEENLNTIGELQKNITQVTDYFQGKLSDCTDRNEFLSNINKEVSMDYGNLSGKYENLVETCEELGNETETMKDELESNRNQLDMAELNITMLTLENENLTSIVAIYEVKIVEMEEIINNSTENDSSNILDDLTKLSHCEIDKNSMELQIKQLVKKNFDLKAESEKKRNESSNCLNTTGDIVLLLDKIEGLEESLNRVNDNLETKMNESAECRESLEITRLLNQQMMQNITKTRHELSTLRNSSHKRRKSGDDNKAMTSIEKLDDDLNLTNNELQRDISRLSETSGNCSSFDGQMLSGDNVTIIKTDHDDCPSFLCQKYFVYGILVLLVMTVLGLIFMMYVYYHSTKTIHISGLDYGSRVDSTSFEFKPREETFM